MRYCKINYLLLGNRAHLLPAKHLATSEEGPSCHRGHVPGLFFLSSPPSSASGFHGKDTQACRVDQDNQCGGRLLCPGLRQMEREGAEGWLVAEPFALLCLKHTSITSSRCQQLSLTETELRGGCTGKQPLSASCVSSAITGLEWPCRPELCVVLGAKMKGDGKLK